MAKDTEGDWLAVTKAPGDRVVLGDDDGVYSVHAALLRTGRVLLWAGGLESEAGVLFRSWTWDPSTFIAGQPLTGVKAQWFLSDFDPGGSEAAPPGSNPTYADHKDVDLFCAHHVTLDDGRLLAVGGTLEPPFSKGNQAVFTFNTKTEQWTVHSPGLQKKRWYPTAVVLQDGRVAIFSGRPGSGLEKTAEILDAEGLKPQIISGGDRKFYIYPGMIMVRGGRIFYVPTAWQYEGASTTANVKTGLGPTSSFRGTGEKSGTWTEHDDPIDPTKSLYTANSLREEGTFVLLPPAQDGRILLIGGGFALNPNNGSTANQQSTEMDVCEVLHTQGGSPRWSPAGKMRRKRSNVHAVLLPDGKVLILGGHDGAKRVHATDQLIPEMFDPKVAYDPANPSAAFTDMAAMGASRLYHATALLLPDGRVHVAGGEDQDHDHPNKHGSNHHSLEIYEPPYCHQGARPEITGIDGIDGPDDELPYGGAIDITSLEASTISSVVLMRLGSTTHHTDTEQRHVPLSFSRSGTTLRAVAVTDPSIAPPGYYMLFIVDDQGRPCKKARVIRLSHRRCTLVTDRATFSVDEIATTGTTSFAKSFYVSVDGFLPSELGVTSATPSPALLGLIAPDITFKLAGTTQTAIRAVPAALHPEDPSLPTGRRQRITFEYTIEISSASIFPPVGQDLRLLDVEAETTVSIDGANKMWQCDGQVRLVRTPNPYMLDGPTHWLSMDVRVFKVKNGSDPYGMTTPVTNPTGYIQELLGKWTALPGPGHPFASIPEGQTDSSLQLAAIENGQPVYNFAVARVRYRGQSLPATDARVFFRMFSTAATNMSYDTNATYRRHTRSSGQTVPLLGIRGGQVASIPFFAVPRVDATTASMESQPEDGPNKQTLPATGGSESVRYFGV